MAARPHLRDFPVHLGLGGRVGELPRFDGTGEWYQRYEQTTAPDGADGRLVSWHEFDTSWDSWEVHPHGDELVLCVSGVITLVQDVGGVEQRVELRAGEWAVNPPGVWHTADLAPDAIATCVFVTAGMGTQNRPR